VKRFALFIFLSVISMTGQVVAEADDQALMERIALDPESSVLPVYQHRPIYGILGRHDAKIAFSFKAKIIEPADIYVGYTQLMMWDVFNKSAPLRDVNFNPEIFYRFAFGNDSAYWFDLGFYEHESNGFDGRNSRSWDRSYLRYHGYFEFSDFWHVLWNFKGWWGYRYDPGSTDLMKYRGAWEFDVTLKNLVSWIFAADDLKLRIYPGDKYYMNPLTGGQEITLRGKIRAKNFLPYLIFQIFHGYGENLLDYNQNHWSLRAGIGY